MERRELLSLGGIAAIAGAFGAGAAAREPSAARSVIRIYSDADGNSHIQELPIATKPGRSRRSDNAAVTGLSFAELPSNTVEDWHRSSVPQFSISLSGEIEVEVSGGKRHAVHTGDIVFLEDLHGQGHITRIMSPVSNIFIRVADGFDIVAWSRGQS